MSMLVLHAFRAKKRWQEAVTFGKGARLEKAREAIQEANALFRGLTATQITSHHDLLIPAILDRVAKALIEMQT